MLYYIQIFLFLGELYEHGTGKMVFAKRNNGTFGSQQRNHSHMDFEARNARVKSRQTLEIQKDRSRRMDKIGWRSRTVIEINIKEISV